MNYHRVTFDQYCDPFELVLLCADISNNLTNPLHSSSETNRWHDGQYLPSLDSSLLGGLLFVGLLKAITMS